MCHYYSLLSISDLPIIKKISYSLPCKIDIKNRNIPDNNIVRVAACFDVGWFTRGTGRTYDSLSGTAALIGYFSKKVIVYVTLNRKCAKCDQGHLPEDHDCRLNFMGSAKAMEPHAAVLLMKDHPILMECNIQVGIFIADNDSSSICAVRAANNHEVLKQSDKNHTSKGVVSELYKISKSFKELTSTDIQYLKKCFNYCISQNQGDEISMAQAIKNIPYHAFNIMIVGSGAIISQILKITNIQILVTVSKMKICSRL